MNLNRFFASLFFFMYAGLFFYMGLGEWAESVEFLLFGSEQKAELVVVQKIDPFSERRQENLNDDEELSAKAKESWMLSSEALAQVHVRGRTYFKPIESLFFFPKTQKNISILYLGQKPQVKVNTFSGLFLAGIFYIIVGLAASFGLWWSLRPSAAEAGAGAGTSERSETAEGAVIEGVVGIALSSAAGEVITGKGTGDFSEVASRNGAGLPIDIPATGM